MSQVVFIHDYIQLIFQDCIINVYNDSEIIPKNKPAIIKGSTGYADSIVQLIDKKITEVTYSEGEKLSLLFSNGNRFNILLGSSAAHGPEAFEISGYPIEDTIVEQNP